MPAGRSFALVTNAALTRLLWLGIVLLALFTVLGLLARHFWLCELFTHFTMQIGVGLAVMTLLTLLLQQWRPGLVALACLIPHLINASYYVPSKDASDTGEIHLNAISFNVLTANRRFDDVRQHLQSHQPDLILLMEVDRAWLAALEPLEEDYPHSVKGPREDNFGMALFSKHPIRSHTLTKVEGSGVPCLHAILEVRGRQLEVIGAHPIPPMGFARARSRNDYLRAVADRVDQAEASTLVMGDFNCTPWSPFFRDLIAETGMTDTGRKRGFQSTWRRHHPAFSIPIDHVLHGDGLICLERSIGPNLGSDHSPIHTSFRFVSPDP